MPDEALVTSQYVFAQIMNIGDYDDVQKAAPQVVDDMLRDVLSHAETGQFNERSWPYWHYHLGLAILDQVPALPAREFE